MATRLGDLEQATEAMNGVPTSQQNVSVSTTTGTQSTAFNGGEILLIVNDGSAKCYFKVGDSTVEATATDGVPLNVDEKMIVTLRRSDTHVAFITSSGTTTARIYEME